MDSKKEFALKAASFVFVGAGALFSPTLTFDSSKGIDVASISDKEVKEAIHVAGQCGMGMGCSGGGGQCGMGMNCSGGGGQCGMGMGCSGS